MGSFHDSLYKYIVVYSTIYIDVQLTKVTCRYEEFHILFRNKEIINSISENYDIYLLSLLTYSN